MSGFVLQLLPITDLFKIYVIYYLLILYTLYW